MTISRIKPILVKHPRVETPQCCAQVHESDNNRYRQWRLERYQKLRPSFDPLKCQRESVVMIDGKAYCRTHAGALALKKWLNGELVTHEEAARGDYEGG